MATIVVNKGRSTHIIGNVTRWGRKATVVGFFHENDVEKVDDILWFFTEGRERGFGIHLSQWEWVYILGPELINQRPLSNAHLIKRPSK